MTDIRKLKVKDLNKYKDEIRNRWANTIGRFLLAMTEIEWYTYWCLIELPRDRIFEAVLEAPLRQRIILICRILEGRKQSGEGANCSNRVLVNLQKVLDLIPVRNLVAHNPQRMTIYGNDEGFHEVVEEIRHHKKKQPVVSYEEMLRYAEQAEELELEILISFQKLLKEVSASQ